MQSNEKQILDLTVPLTETRVTQYFNICVASEMQLRQTILTGIKTKASFASALTLETVMMLTASEIRKIYALQKSCITAFETEVCRGAHFCADLRLLQI